MGNPVYSTYNCSLIDNEIKICTEIIFQYQNFTFTLNSIHICCSARPSKLKAKLIIAGIWLISGALAVPMAVALRVIMIPEGPHGKYNNNVNYNEVSNFSKIYYFKIFRNISY